MQFLLYPLLAHGKSCKVFRLNWQELDILVNGFNSKESVPPQQVEVNAFAKFDHHEHSLSITPFVKDSLLVGSKTIGIPILPNKFPHQQPIKPIVYKNSDVEMILGQYVFPVNKPIEWFQGGNQKTVVDVPMPLGWVFSGPLLLSFGVPVITFKCNFE